MTATVERQELDGLKARVDLLELFRSAGLEPKKRGKNWFCRCPFHEDTEASLSIDPAKRLWNCFSCEAGGDALAFLQRKESLEFLPALQRLRELAGTSPTTPEPGLPSQNTPAYQRNDLLERVIEHYQDCFKKTPAAKQYCNQRGLDSRELWDSFRFGFCDGSLAQKLPAEGGVRQALQQLGVLNEQGKEAFRGCLIVPLNHPDLGWVGLYGRRLNDQAQVKHQYLPGPHQGVLNWQALQTSATMVVTESVLDALSLWRAGHRAVTCVFGVQGVPEHFASLLKNYSVRQVTLVMDGDRAGQKAAQRLSTMFLEAGLECFVVDLPEDSDPNRLLQERGPDGLLQALKNRREILGETPAEPPTFQDGDQSFTATFGDTRYQLWPQAPFTTRLRARLRASRDHRMVMDVVDFYVGRSRKGILNQLIAQLELSRVDGERHLLTLMEHLEKWVASRREQEQEETSEAPTAPELSAAQKEEALHYLKQPRLVQRILNDMEELGYIGEENSKLLGYLISVSRKLEKPLSGVVLSQSGAGKSSLTELVEVMTPPEEVILFSRISPQALYWMPRDGVKRKLLILEERVGGEGADYSIRVLQSRQKLIQAVVIKDPATGKLMTKTFVVEGPIAYLETTTDLRINHENATRCFEIVLDESAEQTKRIHGWQRAQRLPSRQDRRRVQEKLRELHHNAQRLLEPVLVYVPYADKLSFPSRWLRTRRDHERFLCLIEAAAFLHQYQRESGQTEDGSAYVLANLEDYELAYTLAKDLLRSTLHELSREAQELWEQLKEWAQEQGAEATFTRRDVRQLTSGEDYRLRQALGELVEMEYLDASNTGQGRTIHYRLQGGGDTRVPPSLRELTTPEELRSTLRL